MSIRRSRRPEDPYTRLPNATLNDLTLSWEAKGLLDWLLSKPDNWVVHREYIANIGKAGRDKVTSMLAELEAAGYLRREKVRDNEGKFRFESMIYECHGAFLNGPVKTRKR